MLLTDPFDDDKLKEECGIFGIYGHADAAAMTALGLHALQHRGQEAVGVVSFDGQQFHQHRALGLVGDNLNSGEVIARLPGRMAIGHVRYATQGETVLRNVQPLFAHLEQGGFAVGHNGNLTNAIALRDRLTRRGSLFQSTTDTEVIVHLIATSQYGTLIDRLIDALRQIEGAYSLIAVTEESVIGLRDPLGVRPLVLGKTRDGAHILTSESCALDIIDAAFVRDVQPGEIVVLDETGVHSLKPFPPTRRRFCIFEYIYFARPDSKVEGHSVYEVRKRIGAELARESPIAADVVIPVPDSGNPAARGLARAAGLPQDDGFVKNRYVARTFIQPGQELRRHGVRLKFNPLPEVVEGKRLVVVDDSIVRGNTTRQIMQMLRHAGASEIHLRISAPPIKHPCHYGIDMPTREEMIAHRRTVPQIAAELGVDSLHYLSLEGVYEAIGGSRGEHCDACFSGEYPLPGTESANGKHALEVSLPLVKA